MIFRFEHDILNTHKGGISMSGETVYDFLAELCVRIDKNMERMCAIRRTGMEQLHFTKMIEKYDSFLKMVLNSITNEYKFNSNELVQIEELLQRLDKDADDEIFHLAVAVEQAIPAYTGWLGETVFHSVLPMNKNWKETGIEIYPRTVPLWKLDKSERNRRRILNSYLTNYIVVRKQDVLPFQLDVFYWNDTGLLKKTESGWEFSVALSPAMNYAELATKNGETQEGHTIAVEGLKNEEVVTKRILDIFDQLFSKQYSMIVFTEGLGSERLVDAIKERMSIYPNYYTIVVLPTICKDNINRLIVLGPGGVTCLQHDKAAPFILSGKDGIERREQLKYDNHIPVLITQELGMVAFPICAEFIDPDYYRVMVEDAMINTIICPSLSPGIQAFKETVEKGKALKLLQLYINTCSAKAVSRKEQDVPEPLGMVQLPYSEQCTPLCETERICNNTCSKTVCYFDIKISYKNQKFYLEKTHCLCA